MITIWFYSLQTLSYCSTFKLLQYDSLTFFSVFRFNFLTFHCTSCFLLSGNASIQYSILLHKMRQLTLPIFHYKHMAIGMHERWMSIDRQSNRQGNRTSNTSKLGILEWLVSMLSELLSWRKRKEKNLWRRKVKTFSTEKSGFAHIQRKTHKYKYYVTTWLI